MEMQNLSSIIYDNPKLKVFSKKYFRNILLNMSAEEDNYVFFFDFNGIDSLNSKFKYDSITDCMNNTLTALIDALPPDALISRDGGDEFVVSVSKKTFANHFKGLIGTAKLNFDFDSFCDKQLKTNEDLTGEELASIFLQKVIDDSSKNYGLYTYGINASVGASECKAGADSVKAYFQAKTAAKKSKEKTKSSSNTVSNAWKHVRNFCDKSISKVSTCIRASKNYSMDKEMLVSLSKYTNNLIESLLNSTPVDHTVPEESGEFDFPFSQMASLELHKHISRKLDPENAEMFSLDDVSGNLNELPENAIEYVFNMLSKDDLSGYPNRLYLEHYALSDMQEKKYNIALLSTVGVKLSNEIIGYTDTDALLSRNSASIKGRTNSIIKENLAEDHILPEEFTFPVDTSKPFLVDLRGGDYAFIIPADLEISDKTIYNAFSSLDEQKDLPVVYKYFKDQSSSDIKSMLSNISEIFDDIKDPIRAELLLSDEGLKFLEIMISYCIDDFKKAIPDWQNNDTEVFKKIVREKLEERLGIPDITNDTPHGEYGEYR